MLLRTVLDSVTGDMSDTRTRYLGSRPVKLFRIIMQGSEAVSSSVNKFKGAITMNFQQIFLKILEKRILICNIVGLGNPVT